MADAMRHPAILAGGDGPGARAALIRQLQTLPLLPLTDGTFAAAGLPDGLACAISPHAPGTPAHAAAADVAARRQVFFPVTRASPQGCTVLDAAGASALGDLTSLEGLQFLAPGFMCAGGSADERTALRACLMELGIQELHPQHVLWLHVLPAFKQQAAAAAAAGQQPCAEQLVRLLMYPLAAGLIHCSHPTPHQPAVLAALRQHVVLATTQGYVQAPAASLAGHLADTHTARDSPTLSEAAAAGGQLPHSVYFPTALGAPLDFAHELAAYGTWHVLHPAYAAAVRTCSSGGAVSQPAAATGSGGGGGSGCPGVSSESWVWLLKQLGVLMMPPVLRHKVQLRTPQDVAASIWADCAQLTQAVNAARDAPSIAQQVAGGSSTTAALGVMSSSAGTTAAGAAAGVRGAGSMQLAAELPLGGWWVEDAASPDLQLLVCGLARDSAASLVGCAQAAQNKLAALLAVLCRCWDQQYHTAMHATFTPASSADNNPAVVATRLTAHSTLCHVLRTAAWLPASCGTWHRPDQLFLPHPEVHSLLGHHVRYLDAPGALACHLAHDLGVTREVTPKHVLDMLIAWAAAQTCPHLERMPSAHPTTAEASRRSSRSSSSAASQPSPLCAMQHMTHLYLFLVDHATRDACVARTVQAAFSRYPLVWLPSPAARLCNAEPGLLGSWCRLHELVWQDPAAVMEAAAQLQGCPDTAHRPAHQQPGCTRVLGCYYPASLKHLFLEVLSAQQLQQAQQQQQSQQQLGRDGQQASASPAPQANAAEAAGVAPSPSLEQYCAALQAAAKSVHTEMAISLAHTLLQFLAGQYAVGVLRAHHLAYLHHLLHACPLLPTLGGGWAGLGPHTALVDDAATAQRMAGQQHGGPSRLALFAPGSLDTIDLLRLAAHASKQLQCAATPAAAAAAGAEPAAASDTGGHLVWLQDDDLTGQVVAAQQGVLSAGLHQAQRKPAGGSSITLGLMMLDLGMPLLSVAVHPQLAVQRLEWQATHPAHHHALTPGLAHKCAQLNQLLCDVLPVAQRHVHDLIKQSGVAPSQYDACEALATPLLQHVEVQVVSHLTQAWVQHARPAVPPGQQSRQHQLGRSGLLLPAQDVPVALDRSQGVLWVHQASVHDYLALALEFSRVLTGGGAPLPGLADLLYTCMLATAAGQPTQAVLQLKRVPPLPSGVAKWQMPAAEHAATRLQQQPQELHDTQQEQAAALPARAQELEAAGGRAPGVDDPLAGEGSGDGSPVPRGRKRKAHPDELLMVKQQQQPQQPGTHRAEDVGATQEAAARYTARHCGSSGSRRVHDHPELPPYLLQRPHVPAGRMHASNSSAPQMPNSLPPHLRGQHMPPPSAGPAVHPDASWGFAQQQPSAKMQGSAVAGVVRASYHHPSLPAASHPGSQAASDLATHGAQHACTAPASYHATGWTAVGPPAPSALLAAASHPPLASAPLQPYVTYDGSGVALSLPPYSAAGHTPHQWYGRQQGAIEPSGTHAPRHSASGGGGGTGPGVLRLVAPSAAASAAITAVHVPRSILDKVQRQSQQLRTAEQLAGTRVDATGNAQAAANRLQVGRWGEEVVYHYLLQQQQQQQVCALLQHSSTTAHAAHIVEWVNQTQESGAPYDILIKCADGSVVSYVEVKSSTSTNKDFFEVSRAEMAFAEQQRSKYQVVRVRGARSGSPTLTQLVDPVGLWQSQAIKLCLHI